MVGEKISAHLESGDLFQEFGLTMSRCCCRLLRRCQLRPVKGTPAETVQLRWIGGVNCAVG